MAAADADCPWGHLGIVPGKPECACDFPVRKRNERPVRATTGIPDHLPESFELKRVEVCHVGLLADGHNGAWLPGEEDGAEPLLPWHPTGPPMLT
jgi:hypothetical protein